MTDALEEQIAYYRARAAEYDSDAYETRPAEWHAEMAALVAAFDDVGWAGREVVELAAGTGFWTSRLVASGASVTALDASPEMLAVAASKSPGVTTVVTDLLRWSPARTWDGLVACFWLAHVPEAQLASMLSAMASAVRPGGVVFVADKAGGSPNTARVLRDGRPFSVVDERRPPASWAPRFEAAGFVDVSVSVVGRRFVAITGVRR